jgi:hypothetical protein
MKANSGNLSINESPAPNGNESGSVGGGYRADCLRFATMA